MRAWIVLPFLLAPTFAAAEPYFVAGESTESVTFIDQASIKRSGDIVRVWEMNVDKAVTIPPPPSREGPVNYVINLEAFDCANDTVSHLVAVDYDMKGQPTTTPLTGAPVAIVPDTVGSSVEAYVCQGKTTPPPPIPHNSDRETLAREARQTLKAGQLVP